MLAGAFPLGQAARAATRPWHPASLFGAGETGYVLDPSDGRSMFQDTAGTTSPVVGSPVRLIRDLSPNRSAPQNSNGPVLAAGYLDFDGTDDALAQNFTLNQPFTRISAINQQTWASGDQIFGGGANNAGVLLQAGVSPQIGIFDGSAIIGTLSATLLTWFVVIEVHNGGSSSVQLGLAGTPATGNPGATGPGGVALAKRSGVETYADVLIGRVVTVGRVLTAAEIANTVPWVGYTVGLAA